MDKQEALRLLSYYTKERDIEDCNIESLEKALEFFPEIKIAYDNYIYAKKVLNLLVDEENEK